MAITGRNTMRTHVGTEYLPFLRSSFAQAAARRSARPFRVAAAEQAPRQQQQTRAKRGGLAELGPIGMTFGSDHKQVRLLRSQLQNANCFTMWPHHADSAR